jgi:hypothetical protein
LSGIGAVKGVALGSKDYLQQQSVNLPKLVNPVYHYRKAENIWDTRKNRSFQDEQNDVWRKETDLERQIRRRHKSESLDRSFSGGNGVGAPNINLADNVRAEYRRHDMKYNRALHDRSVDGRARTYIADPVVKSAAGNWGARRAALSVGKSVSAKANGAKTSASDQGARAACLVRTMGRGPCDQVIDDRRQRREEKMAAATTKPRSQAVQLQIQQGINQEKRLKTYFDEQKADGVQLPQRPGKPARKRD